MRYQHDCKKCVSLGEYQEYDLYFCSQIIFGESWSTLIGRYGNSGEEFKSRPLRNGFWTPVQPWERVAIKIAMQENLFEKIVKFGQNSIGILDNSV